MVSLAQSSSPFKSSSRSSVRLPSPTGFTSDPIKAAGLPDISKPKAPTRKRRASRSRKNKSSGGGSSSQTITAPMSIDPIKAVAAPTGRGGLSGQSSSSFGGLTSAPSTKTSSSQRTAASIGTPFITESERKTGAVGFVSPARNIKETQVAGQLLSSRPIQQTDVRKVGLFPTRAERITNTAEIFQREAESKKLLAATRLAEKQISEGKSPSVEGLSFKTTSAGLDVSVSPELFSGDLRQQSIIGARKEFSSLPTGKKAALIGGDIFQGASKVSRGVTKFFGKKLVVGLGGKLTPELSDTGEVVGFKSGEQVLDEQIFKSKLKTAPEAPLSTTLLANPKQFAKEILTDPSRVTQIGASAALIGVAATQQFSLFGKVGVKQGLVQTSKGLSPVTVKEGFFRIPTEQLKFTGTVLKTPKGEIIKGVDVLSDATIKGVQTTSGKTVRGLFDISQPVIRVGGGGTQLDIGTASTLVRTSAPKGIGGSKVTSFSPAKLGGKGSQLISGLKGTQFRISGVTTEASLDILSAGKFGGVKLETGAKQFEPLATTVQSGKIVTAGTARSSGLGKFKLAKQDISFIGNIQQTSSAKAVKDSGIGFPSSSRSVTTKVQTTTLGLPSFKGVTAFTLQQPAPAQVVVPLVSRTQKTTQTSRPTTLSILKSPAIQQKEILDITPISRTTTRTISKRASKQRQLDIVIQKQIPALSQQSISKQLPKGRQVNEFAVSKQSEFLSFGVGLNVPFFSSKAKLGLPKISSNIGTSINIGQPTFGSRLGPSFTGLVTGVESSLPKELSIGGISPFELRGISPRKKKKKKGVKK